MALVFCPGCGKQVSEYAKSCPNCGYSVNATLHSITGENCNTDDNAITEILPP